MTVIAPMIHMNGTSQRELLDQIQSAYTALQDACKAIAVIAPHMRDYYPMENGATVYRQAYEAHYDRLKTIGDVMKEYEDIAAAIYEQGK